MIKGRRRRRVIIAILATPLALAALLLLAALAQARYQTWWLRSSLGAASALRIRTGGHCHRFPESEFVLFETTDGPTIADVLRRVSLRPSMPGLTCKCCGDLTFEFYDGTRLIGAFSYHHRAHIRVQGDRFGDRALSAASRRSLNDWLAQQGITAHLDWLDRRPPRGPPQTMPAPPDADPP